MASAAIALRQRSVRDLPDERLNELVLTPLRRPRINLLPQELQVDQRSQPGLQRGGRLACELGQGSRREALAQNGGVLEEGAVGRLQRIQTSRDERVQGFRNRRRCGTG